MCKSFKKQETNHKVTVANSSIKPSQVDNKHIRPSQKGTIGTLIFQTNRNMFKNLKKRIIQRKARHNNLLHQKWKRKNQKMKT